MGCKKCGGKMDVSMPRPKQGEEIFWGTVCIECGEEGDFEYKSRSYAKERAIEENKCTYPGADSLRKRIESIENLIMKSSISKELAKINRESKQISPDAIISALEDMCCQFSYWNNKVGGLTTGGLFALEEAFRVLGWSDPYSCPNLCCDEKGCKERATCGFPTLGEYRHTCGKHYREKENDDKNEK